MSMGNESGGGSDDPRGAQEGGNVIRVDFSKHRKEESPKGGSLLSSGTVESDLLSEDAYRLRYGFIHIPEQGSTNNQWKAFLHGLCPDARMCDENKEDPEPFLKIVSNMFLADIQRILKKENAYGRLAPGLFQALKYQAQICEVTQKSFESLCVTEGIHNNAPKEAYKDLLADFESEEQRALLALGPNFFSNRPGALAALAELHKAHMSSKGTFSSLKVSLSEGQKPVNEQPPAFGEKSNVSEHLKLLETDESSLRVRLMQLTIAFDEAGELLKTFPESNTPHTSAPIEELIQKQVKNICNQGQAGVIAECKKLQRSLSAPRPNVQEEARKYALLRNWLVSEKVAVEKRLIEGFLEREDVKKAYRRVCEYISELPEDASQAHWLPDNIAAYKSDMLLIPTYELLNAPFLRKLKTFVATDNLNSAFLVGLVELLQERLKSLE